MKTADFPAVEKVPQHFFNGQLSDVTERFTSTAPDPSRPERRRQSGATHKAIAPPPLASPPNEEQTMPPVHGGSIIRHVRKP